MTTAKPFRTIYRYLYKELGTNLNRTNHILAGAVLAEGYLAYTNHLYNLRMILKPEDLIILGPTVAAIFLGAVFPDVDVRLNLRGFHRTVFHWPWLYLAIIALALTILPRTPGVIDLVFGFTLASLVHIEMDYHTKSGVPFGLNPFGRKYSSKRMHVNSPEELLVSGLMLGIGLFVYWGPILVMKF